MSLPPPSPPPNPPPPYIFEIEIYCAINAGNCDVIASLPTSSCDVWGSAMTTDSAGASLSDLPESGTRTLQFGADHECLQLYYADGGDLQIVNLTLNGENVLHCISAPSLWTEWGCGTDGVAADGENYRCAWVRSGGLSWGGTYVVASCPPLPPVPIVRVKPDGMQQSQCITTADGATRCVALPAGRTLDDEAILRAIKLRYGSELAGK